LVVAQVAKLRAQDKVAAPVVLQDLGLMVL
jgi:hypothetical protein